MTAGGGTPDAEGGAGTDPTSGTGSGTTEKVDSLPSDDSNDAFLPPGEGSPGEGPPGEGPQGKGHPRHARPPRTAGDYARALLHRLRAQAPLAAVLAVVVLGFVRIGLQHWREGTTVVGAALLLAAVLRVALPDRTAGLLAVRPRRTDVVTYAAFGLVVILLSLTITGGPLADR